MPLTKFARVRTAKCPCRYIPTQSFRRSPPLGAQCSNHHRTGTLRFTKKNLPFFSLSCKHQTHRNSPRSAPFAATQAACLLYTIFLASRAIRLWLWVMVAMIISTPQSPAGHRGSPRWRCQPPGRAPGRRWRSRPPRRAPSVCLLDPRLRGGGVVTTAV